MYSVGLNKISGLDPDQDPRSGIRIVDLRVFDRRSSPTSVIDGDKAIICAFVS